MTIKNKTINEIMSNKEDLKSKVLLKSSNTADRKQYFTPWFYYNHYWYGIIRLYSNYSKRTGNKIKLGRRKANRKIWIIQKEKMPILPKNHPVRCQLEMKEKIFNYGKIKSSK